MNKNYSPGLEVDRGDQDEYPTVYDGPHLQPIAAVQQQNAWPRPGEKTARVSKGWTCGLRRSTFGLVVALAFAVTMATVCAGVAGSLAASRKADADRKCEARFQPDSYPSAANG